MNEQQRQQILNDTVNQFARHEWFRDAIIYNNHPNTGGPTLEVKVNYVPVMERRDVIAFTQSKGLQYFFTVVDANGNKVL